MKTKTSTKVQSIMDTMKRRRLEKIKASYGLTESELKFLLSLSSRYQMQSPVLHQVLSKY